MIDPPILLTVVVPAYDEQKRIGKTLRELDSYFTRQSYGYEIVVVNDGSRDHTADVVRQLAPSIKNLRLIDNSENRGKGWAVRQGVLAAKGQIIVFTDADNSTSIEHIERIIPEFEKGCAVVIGSRRVPGAIIVVHQPLMRELIGRVFNVIVQCLTGLPMKDTQAGFKAFSALAAREIFSRQTVLRWAFDVEVLTIAQQLGFGIKEVPITWVNDPDSRIRWKDIVGMLGALIKIRLNLMTGAYRRRAKDGPP
jgi:dolichyl-phosphate beta-glucosyltransferase